MSATANLKVVQFIYEAFGRGDLPAILDACAPDIVWESIGPATIPHCGVRTGHEGAKQFFADLLSNLAIEDFTPVEMHADDDAVFVVGTETMRRLTTGTAVTHRWIHAFWISGGKVTRFQESGDTGTILSLFL